jgi:hypothetical protein
VDLEAGTSEKFVQAVVKARQRYESSRLMTIAIGKRLLTEISVPQNLKSKWIARFAALRCHPMRCYPPQLWRVLA